MSQSLKALMSLSNGVSWPIGGLKATTEIMLPANTVDTPSQAVVMDYSGMKILFRGAQYTALQSEYPTFFSQVGSGFGVSTYTTRTLTGQTNARWMDSNGSVLVGIGAGGIISRSTDGGVTWSAVTSPVALDLKRIKYVPAISKWIIPYTTNKCLISSDNGATFVDTTVTGLSINLSTTTGDIRLHIIGSIIVLCTDSKTYTSTNGTAWTEVLVGVGSSRRLTIGNGYFVVLYHNGTNLTFQYSTNGTAWSAGTTLINDSTWYSTNSGYGLCYNGAKWIWIHGGVTSSEYLSTYLSSGPMPPPGYYTAPLVSAPIMQYSANGSPGSAFSTLSFTTGGNDFTGWQNWKPGFGTQTYWFYPSFTIAWLMGPTTYTMPNSINLTYNSTNRYMSYEYVYQNSSSSTNNAAVSFADGISKVATLIANGVFSDLSSDAVGQLWSTVSSPSVMRWSSTNLGEGWITADSYYFYTQSNGTLKISGSATTPATVISANNGYIRLA